MTKYGGEWMDLSRIIGNEINQIAEMIPGGFFIYEAEGKETILYANLATAEIFGCQTKEEFRELTGGTFSGMVYNEDYPQIEQSIEEQIATNKDMTDNVAYRIVKKDGTIGWVEDYGKLIVNGQGKKLFYVFISDITEKKLQQEKEELYKLLQHLNGLHEVARLVDVSKAVVYTVQPDGSLTETNQRCFSVWGKEHRCENCISAKALASKGYLTKYEFVGTEPFHVTAKYVEFNGRPFILELVSKVDNECLLEAYGKQGFADTIAEYNRKLYVDSLTGAFNRYYLEEQLEHLTDITAIAIMDIDHFKSINDTFGHDAGDVALKMVVDTIKACIRKEDTVIRLGGDEFLLIFEKIPQEKLEERLNHIRKEIGALQNGDYPSMKISVSIGAIVTSDCSSESRKRADQALYDAKQSRNQVKIAE